MLFPVTSSVRLPIPVYLVGFHLFIIIASNYLVQLPLLLFGWHTTWGAFSFPFIFLATDLTARMMGKHKARQVVARAMLPALIVSYLISVIFQEGSWRGLAALGEWNAFIFRISLASFCAYVLGQLLDIQVFDRLRRLPQWWVAPAVSGVFGNALDTAAFFSIAFYRSENPFMASNWVEIAFVDYVIKLLISFIFFLPLYGLLLNAIVKRLRRYEEAATH